MTSWPDHSASGNQKQFWRNGNQIDAAFIFARPDFVNVHHLHRRKFLSQSQARSGAGILHSFRVTSRRILRTTSVNSQK
jgi:hypothetical protein